MSFNSSLSIIPSFWTLYFTELSIPFTVPSLSSRSSPFFGNDHDDYIVYSTHDSGLVTQFVVSPVTGTVRPWSRTNVNQDLFLPPPLQTLVYICWEKFPKRYPSFFRYPVLISLAHQIKKIKSPRHTKLKNKIPFLLSYKFYKWTGDGRNWRKW